MSFAENKSNLFVRTISRMHSKKSFALSRSSTYFLTTLLVIDDVTWLFFEGI